MSAEAISVQEQYKRLRKQTPTGIELYFSKDPVPADRPVYVFQHAMKTAGTAVRALIYANLSGSTTYMGQDAPKSAKHNDLPEWYGDLIDQFSREEQSRLLWAIGHTAAYAAPLIRVKRPVRIFTVVRQPVEQVVSRHFFADFRDDTPPDRAQLVELLRFIFASPTEAERYRHKGYWNLQSQSILAPYFDVSELHASRGPTPDADVWRRRLADLVDRACVLLVQDHLDDDIAWFAAQQHWQITELPKMRVNPERPAVADLDPELRTTIEAYNWLDVELYRLAMRQRGRTGADGR
jgi:hypothetical protein